jgi:hypothetical protein
MDCIPLKNIFFASVKSFEELVKVVIANGNVISRVLKKATEENSDPSTKKYLFEMHLDAYERALIPILEEIFEGATGELEARLC